MSKKTKKKHHPPAPPDPTVLTVRARKWFCVAKTSHVTGARLRVTPDKNERNIILRPGWEVAWVLGNDADNVQDLRIMSFEVDGEPVESPIRFDLEEDGVVMGTVTAVGIPGNRVRYKYTVKSGKTKKDPEIIIEF